MGDKTGHGLSYEVKGDLLFLSRFKENYVPRYAKVQILIRNMISFSPNKIVTRSIYPLLPRMSK